MWTTMSQKQYKGRFWEAVLIDVWHLPVHRWRLWVAWFLHLGVQGFHGLALPWALWSVQHYGAAVRRVVGSDPGIHWIRVTAKRPVKLLDLCIVTFPSLSLSKFSSFCLDSEKLKEGWNRWMSPLRYLKAAVSRHFGLLILMETSEGFQFQFAMRRQVYLGHWSLDWNNATINIGLLGVHLIIHCLLFHC